MMYLPRVDDLELYICMLVKVFMHFNPGIGSEQGPVWTQSTPLVLFEFAFYVWWLAVGNQRLEKNPNSGLRPWPIVGDGGR